MKKPQAILAFSFLTALATLPLLAGAQTLDLAGESTVEPTTVVSGQTYLNYTAPTHNAMVKYYLLDTFGPYPLVITAASSGMNQWSNTPPEWKQGAEGFGRRFGSNFGMSAVGTTTLFALSAAFKQDPLYYSCQCKGVWPRMGHAVISTVTARREQNGRRVFSAAALASPYAGATTAVYGWYPDRFGAKDAFRMGNYSLLINVGGNVALEFLIIGPHSLLGRLHLNSWYGAPGSGTNN